ncbi:hypothetical protein [Streptomyces sp. cmx-18-6]|uniref:hypothetical protein n=1 Tax=Streptomyces sp. cmx-18-6 TaxID=2790930 RepID=UPI003980AD96
MNTDDRRGAGGGPGGRGPGDDRGFGDDGGFGDGGGPDALMAVLLGEPAPPGDGPAARRHEAARQDMDVLGAQVRLIGDRLAASGEEAGDRPGAGEGAAYGTSPLVPRPGRPRPRRKKHLALAACVLLVAGLAGAGILRAVAIPAGGDGAAKLTEEGIVACARLVVDGTVVRTESAASGVRVVLDVERSLRPERGPDRADFLVPGEEAGSYRPGTRMTVVVSRFPDEPVMAYTGARERADAWERLSAALPDSGGLECPGPG